ncbi:hypothetical protein SGRA_1059 [Saprospira grandis str. Lewin]|uniref:DUF481 domain-containing protein n=1 Tax=Saprospira grandis (strain Lewin) TaxID=984262 RepID=H6L3E7_SAPGL|nr:hypothetical protein SGRA_1059 [Saprospira grandis str. Lewin]
MKAGLTVNLEKNLLKTIKLFLLLLLALPLKAQILNADALAPKLDSSRAFHLFGQGNLSITKRNYTPVYSFTGQAEWAYHSGQHQLMHSNYYRLLRSAGENTLNSGYTHFRYRLAPEEGLQYELFAQFQGDQIRGMQERYLLGGNLRLKLRQKDKTNLFLGLGGMYESEKWTYSAVEDSLLPADISDFYTQYAKLNFYLSYWEDFNPKLRTQLVLYLQTRPDSEWQKARIFVSNEWSWKIAKHWALAFGAQLNYELAPPVPLAKFYYTTSWALKYSW